MFNSYFYYHKLSKNYVLYSDNARKLQNKYLKHMFYKIKANNKQPTQKDKKTENKEDKEKPKKKKRLKEGGLLFYRLNIYPLLIDGKDKQKFLHETLLNLLNLLYKDKDFYSEEFSSVFINELLSHAEKFHKENNVKNFQLEKIICNKEKIKQDLYYNILKGNKNYPALLNFIEYIPIEQTSPTSAETKIFINLMPLEILKAVFYQEADLIDKMLRIRIERKLTSEDLKEILANTPHLDKVNKFNFSNNYNSKKVTFAAKGNNYFFLKKTYDCK